MPIYNIFSKRQRVLRGEVPELYIYDSFSEKIKVQIMHIWDDAIGIDHYTDVIEEKTYEVVRGVLCREYGVYHLFDSRGSYKNDLRGFFLKEGNSEKILDVIEISFKYIDVYIRENSYKFPNKKINSNEAVQELNDRFKEHGIGFSFENNEIIRIDSVYTHSEITKPVISLLLNSRFKGANDEYMKAHEHYKNGRNKECLNECLKALESSLKTICNIKNWEYEEKATASSLIRICFENDLVPSYVQNQFTSLQNLITSGVPSIRNNQGGHGQGENIKVVDDNLARYALNLLGTNLIFLINQSGVTS